MKWGQRYCLLIGLLCRLYKKMFAEYLAVWQMVGSTKMLVVLNHYFAIKFTTVIRLEVAISMGKECILG